MSKAMVLLSVPKWAGGLEEVDVQVMFHAAEYAEDGEDGDYYMHPGAVGQAPVSVLMELLEVFQGTPLSLRVGGGSLGAIVMLGVAGCALSDCVRSACRAGDDNL